ncbi:hypothetical protein BDW02DRAFT_579630 [Decorospora gaudefroyi]|uniref:Ubiquitin-like protease family profile domain-containing protein n=1 Tax=Decorospora gaudefroyi TaxID=184978 RepID=A0A6A5KJ88_9PLEO|nr:hypothetical protein BDW02DRAFT_579630 [Decorospora gaudefroyi]
MSASTNDGESGSAEGMQAVAPNSPDRAQPQIGSQTRMASSHQESAELASQSEVDVPSDSQLQGEACVDHMSSVSPPSTQDRDAKTSTTPSTTPPSTEYTVAICASAGAASPQKVASPPTPTASTTASSSELTPSPPTGPHLPNMTPQAREARHLRTHIYQKTRQTIRVATNKMSLVAARGFERGILPTRQTVPPLLKRRYSIDANTTPNWSTWLARNLKGGGIEVHNMRKSSVERSTNSGQRAPQNLQAHHLDPLPTRAPWYMPDPSRYAAFATVWSDVPFNTGIYLELGDVTLHNDAFWWIGATSATLAGPEVWMRDESLDMALEVLRRDANCDAHSIAIANSTMAQICYFAAMGGVGSMNEYVEYKMRFYEKQWIFLVVNDAIGCSENTGTSGTHWSLVAMDRRAKRTYYYDSLYVNNGHYQQIGQDISLGMLRILGEDLCEWRYQIAYNSPNHFLHNQFSLDGGACGPFVFKMVEMLVDRIKWFQSVGREDECCIDLEPDFPSLFKNAFHSQQVRFHIQKSIRRWKGIDVAPGIADLHDLNAIQGAGVVLTNGPVVAFDIPRRAVLSVAQQDRRTRKLRTRSRNRSLCRAGSTRETAIDVDDVDNVVGNMSDDSEASSNATVIIYPSSDGPSEDETVDLDMDDTEESDDDDEGGVSIVDPENLCDDPVSDGHSETTLSPQPSDSEDDS